MDFSKSQLSISHLKMICQLESCDTVKEAAQSLFITQPAMTNRIREAERRLNTQLFYRRGRRIIMSNAGKRLLVSAKKILEELSRAEHDISRLLDGVEQVVRLGLPHYATFGWLPDVIQGFNQKMPHIELEIASQTALKPLANLVDHEVDMTMVCSANSKLEFDIKQFITTPLVSDELVACLSSKHKKSNKDYLLPEDFLEETYVTNSMVAEKDREYELFFQPAGILPKKVLQVGFNEAIIELVKANIGVSILSKRQLEKYINTGNSDAIKQIPLTSSGLPIHWHLVYLNNANIIEPGQCFVDLLKQQLNDRQPLVLK